jgi:hypothetical protein
MLRLVGLDITDDSILALVTRLRRADYDQQADTIVGALMSLQTEVVLTPSDQVAVLTVLDDPPAELEELRAVLQEQVGRVRDGLA